MEKVMTETDDLNIGDKVIYQSKNTVITDHYGAGNYAVQWGEDWKSVKRGELTKEEVV